MTICTKHSYGGPQACPYCDNDQLRADLATVTAERNDLRGEVAMLQADVAALKDGMFKAHGDWDAERTAHEATRAELAEVRKALDAINPHVTYLRTELASTRTELSAAQERVRELETELEETETEGGEWQRRAESAEPIMAQALALCEKLDGPSSVACDIERALEALRG